MAMHSTCVKMRTSMASDYISRNRRRLRSFLFSLDPLVSGHVQLENMSSEQASTIHLPHSVIWCLGLPQRDPSALASSSFMFSLSLRRLRLLPSFSVHAPLLRKPVSYDVEHVENSQRPAVNFPCNSANFYTALPAALPACSPSPSRTSPSRGSPCLRSRWRFTKALADRRFSSPPPPVVSRSWKPTAQLPS